MNLTRGRRWRASSDQPSPSHRPPHREPGPSTEIVVSDRQMAVEATGWFDHPLNLCHGFEGR